MDDLSALDDILAELKDDLDIPGFDEDLLRSMAAEASAVTERLQKYGTLDAGEIETIRAAGERKAAYMESGLPGDSENANAAPVENSVESVETEPASEDGERETVRRSVVCPRCGETIWL